MYFKKYIWTYLDHEYSTFYCVLTTVTVDISLWITVKKAESKHAMQQILYIDIIGVHH